ncbi:hypothetical protein HYU17_06110 [Candidatus Woesearchaeota archaeon]|nr:hypothetical protein [Candidatus Woesearchaeota archaeon]
MNDFHKICEKVARSTGHWTSLRLSFINDFTDDDYELRAHAELPNNAFPSDEAASLKAIMQLLSTCPSLRNENSQSSAGILTLDEFSGDKKMKRKQIRTKKELVKDVQSLAELDNRYLNYNFVRGLKRNDLLFDAVKLFGGWRGAIEAAGYRPIQKGWTENEIPRDVQLVQKRFGQIPPYKRLSGLGYSGLTRAAMRRFGSWNKAVIKAGFVPIKKEWSKNSVTKELKTVAQNLNRTPSMRDLKRLGKDDLLNAMISRFGKYNSAIKEANLPTVLEMNKRTRKKVVTELKIIAKKLGKKPTSSEVKSLGRHDAYNAALSEFGSWNKAMIAAGFTPNTDAVHNKLGQIWENIVLKIASEIYPDSGVHFKLPNRGLPDLYVPDEKLVIEAKINISENNVKADTEKYLPYCDRLQIWHLYGIPPSTFSDKIEVVGIDIIKKFIMADSKLKNKFKSLIREVGGKYVTKEKPNKVLMLGSGALNA